MTKSSMACNKKINLHATNSNQAQGARVTVDVAVSVSATGRHGLSVEALCAALAPFNGPEWANEWASVVALGLCIAMGDMVRHDFASVALRVTPWSITCKKAGGLICTSVVVLCPTNVGYRVSPRSQLYMEAGYAQTSAEAVHQNWNELYCKAQLEDSYPGYETPRAEGFALFPGHQGRDPAKVKLVNLKTAVAMDEAEARMRRAPGLPSLADDEPAAWGPAPTAALLAVAAVPAALAGTNANHIWSTLEELTAATAAPWQAGAAPEAAWGIEHIRSSHHAGARPAPAPAPTPRAAVAGPTALSSSADPYLPAAQRRNATEPSVLVPPATGWGPPAYRLGVATSDLARTVRPPSLGVPRLKATVPASGVSGYYTGDISTGLIDLLVERSVQLCAESGSVPVSWKELATAARNPLSGVNAVCTKCNCSWTASHQCKVETTRPRGPGRCYVCNIMSDEVHMNSDVHMRKCAAWMRCQIEI